jgi:hypothetical protein
MLTYKQIDNAKPADAPFRLYDSGKGMGLFILVNPSGSKLWRLKYSLKGKRCLKALGAFPDVSLQDARLEAAAFRKALEDGFDPAAEDRHTVTFQAVAREWASRFLPGLADITGRQTLAKLNNKILPVIGSLPMDRITTPLVLEKVLRPIEAEGKLETLYSVKTIMSQIFRYAVAGGLMERDFTLDLKGAFPPKKPVHRAAITDPARLGELFRAADAYPGVPVVRYALRMLPYVFTRPGELRNAVWLRRLIPELMTLDKNGQRTLRSVLKGLTAARKPPAP